MFRLTPFFLLAVVQAAPTVSKIEPPNWWVGHSINPIRLLVTGTGFEGATVIAPAGTTASEVVTSRSGRYLFITLSISTGITPGEYPLRVTTESGSTTVPFRLDKSLETTNRFRGFSSDDVIYLIMPDRFSNGDLANDAPRVSRATFDRKATRYYHGGDLQGIINHLPYLKELGVTALWMTPVYDNTNQVYPSPLVSGQLVTDYHGYGTIDYYAVDEHFGDMKLLRRLVDEAHRHGIRVIQDQVANHVSPVHPWTHDTPTTTWFNGTAAKHLTETFNLWNLIDPHADGQLVRAVLDGWFGDFLPDMNQNDPEVARYEIQNALWWVGMSGFDGIRQDTLPYVPRTFWSSWSAALKKQYPDLRVVGEVLDADPAITSYYQGGRTQEKVDSGIDTVFDYPLYFRILGSFARGGDLEQVIKIMADDVLYPDPAPLVTMLDGHDVTRFMSEKGATAKRLQLALTFLLTARGTPVIYYGDEIGMPGAEDPDNRRDFPGGWPGDAHNAFERGGRSPEEAAIFDFVRKLLALRAQEEPLRRGKMINLMQGKQTWVYARRTATATVLVALNLAEQPAAMRVELSDARESFRSLLGTTGNLNLKNGSTTIHLPAMSAEIYSAQSTK